MTLERLAPTRVRRFYTGGALIDRLRGEPESDTSFPEDWLGSVTPASNPGRDDPEEGLSRLADGRLLRDVIDADRKHWLGGADSTGLLVKLLDAAERLPVHAHPDRAFARRHLDSPFGKTEAWIVLDMRGDESEVWVGLSRAVDPRTYRAWIEAQDVASLLGSLNRLAVRRGDVVFVPAGVPHAIGAGVLIAQLQEPTDYSVICEWAGFPIDAEDAHLGLGWDAALGALDLRSHEPVLLCLARRRSSSGRRRRRAGGAVRRAARRRGRGRARRSAGARGRRVRASGTAEPFSVSGVRVLRCLAPGPPVGVDDRAELT